MNKLYEAFRWYRPDIRVTSQTGGKIHIRGKAIYPTVSRNNRQYIEEELKKAARTLAGKPIDVNHEADYWLIGQRKAEAAGERYTVPKPTYKGHVVDAEYEDGAIEYVAEINHPEYVAKLKDMKNLTAAEYREAWEKDPIYGVSISANFRYAREGATDTPVTPLGINFVRLSLVEDPETPGVRGTSIEFMETLNEGSVEECLITGSLFKDRVSSVYEVYNQEVLGKLLNDGDRMEYNLPVTFTDPNDPRTVYETEEPPVVEEEEPEEEEDDEEEEDEEDKKKKHKEVLVDEIKKLVYDIPKMEKIKMTGKNAGESLQEKQTREREALEATQNRERMEAEMTALNDYIAQTVEKVNTVIDSIQKVTDAINDSNEKHTTESLEIRGLVRELGEAIEKLTGGLDIAVGRVDEIKETIAAEAEEKAALKESLEANKGLVEELKAKLDESREDWTSFKESYATDKEELTGKHAELESKLTPITEELAAFKEAYTADQTTLSEKHVELEGKVDGMEQAVENSVEAIKETFTPPEETETPPEDDKYDKLMEKLETLQAQIKGEFKAPEEIIDPIDDESFDETIVNPSRG